MGDVRDACQRLSQRGARGTILRQANRLAAHETGIPIAVGSTVALSLNKAPKGAPEDSMVEGEGEGGEAKRYWAFHGQKQPPRKTMLLRMEKKNRYNSVNQGKNEGVACSAGTLACHFEEHKGSYVLSGGEEAGPQLHSIPTKISLIPALVLVLTRLFSNPSCVQKQKRP